MKIAIVKMVLNVLTGLLRSLAPMTSNKIDDKVVREVDRVKEQVLKVLG